MTLNTGRRWEQFYYKGEDIAPYVPQILYFLESDQRFTTIDEALAFAKANRRSNPRRRHAGSQGVRRGGNASNLLVISSVDSSGRPVEPPHALRQVGHVRGSGTCRPHPTDPRFASSTRAGSRSLRSQRRTVRASTAIASTSRGRRSDSARSPICFEEQVPGYLDTVTEADLERELVYELTLRSARVDTWMGHDQVDFYDD